ncbi:MAG TPA: hypothetical protein VH575_13935 [Gemmataceae bacterium]|jgi:prolyl oligopeptidase PreP (S9A serine peptidase family)
MNGKLPAEYEELEVAGSSTASKTTPVKADLRTTITSKTLHWNDWNHESIYYTRCQIVLYTNGDWVFSCNMHNRSRHSDWDVTIDLKIVTAIGGAEVAVLGTGLCSQDLDHGENYDKGASGYHAEIWRGWQHFEDDTWAIQMVSHKTRDN